MWRREQLDSNVFRVTCDVKRRRDWEAYALLSSDRHFDNPKSDLALQLQHLQEAKERKAIVVDAGDMFCAMQGKYDRRASKAQVRPEHQRDDYLDSLVETAAAFFAPYQEQFLCIGHGNHETAIKTRHETDLTERLVATLNDGRKTKVYNGHFSGYVIFSFAGAPLSGQQHLARKNGRVVLKYTHGWGGGGPITQDMIQQSRRAMVAVDADIIMSGHTHDAWCMERQVERLTDKGKIKLCPQTAIKLPSYKDEYNNGKGGWHVETGKPPKPLGAYWLRFFWNHKLDAVDYEVTRAK